MMQSNTAKIRFTATILGLTLLAGCVTPPPPAPPPPPPPPVEVIPPRPVAPSGVDMNMYIPPRDVNGIRQTVNYGLSTSQTIWNVRSAMNVAALNCREPQHAPILPAYRDMLTSNSRELTRISDRIQAEFREKYGREGRSQFDGYMTQVYNYFALPPAKARFCDAATEVATAYTAAGATGLEAFSTTNLPRLEKVFDDFYSSLEQYKADVAAWDARYTMQPGLVTGGPEPVPPSSGLPTSVMPVGVPASNAGSTAAPAADTATPQQPAFVSEPVVMPLPEDNAAADAGGGSGSR